MKDSEVRNEKLADTNVCCGDNDLTTDVKNAINWSLTKDPRRCQEFEKDGYKLVIFVLFSYIISLRNFKLRKNVQLIRNTS